MLNFRRVPIFTEGPIYEIAILYELRKENIMATNFEPHKCVILVKSTEIGISIYKN